MRSRHHGVEDGHPRLLHSAGHACSARAKFRVSDREGSGRVVIVNEALAEKFFPDEDPIGRLLLTFDERGDRIIGVVANAAEAALTDGAVPARYMLYEQMPFVYAAGFRSCQGRLRATDSGRARPCALGHTVE